MFGRSTTFYKYRLPDNEPDLHKLPAIGSDKIGPIVWDLFLIAMHHKEELALNAQWALNHRYYAGEHDALTADTDDSDILTANLIWPYVRRRKAMMTDKAPTPEILAYEDKFRENAKSLAKTHTLWWRYTKQLTKLMRYIHFMQLYGVGITKAVYNPWANGGMGEVETRHIDPHHAFPPPGYLEPEDFPWHCEGRPIDISAIESRWPHARGKVEADETMTGDAFGDNRQFTTPGGGWAGDVSTGKAPQEYRWFSKKSSGYYGHTPIKRAIVVECWIRDSKLESVDVPEGDGTVRYNQPVSPGMWRRVIVTNQGKLVLSDLPNPNINPNVDRERSSQTYLYHHLPYDYNRADDDAVTIWGVPAVSQLRRWCEALGDHLTMINTFGRHSVRPILVIPATAGITEDEVKEAAKNKQIVLQAATEQAANNIRFIQPMPLPGDFFNMVKVLVEMFNMVSSQFDVDVGRQPGSLSAASAILALQEKNNALIRGEIRALDDCLVFMGRSWLSLMLNWQTDERLFVDAQPNGQTQSWAIQGPEMMARYEFQVASGSTMPEGRQAQSEQAIQLFQLGAIDARALLERIGFKGVDETLDRVLRGPMGQIFDKAAPRWQAVMGVPPERAQQLIEVAMADDKEFEKFMQQQQAQGQGQPALTAVPGGQA